jgi:hypothetical protein
MFAQLILEAGREARKFELCLKSSSRAMTLESRERSLHCYTRFVALYSRCVNTLTPKFHLMFHQIVGTSKMGNPKYYHSYSDESFNGLLAKIAKSCHRACWGEQIFRKLSISRVVHSKRLKVSHGADRGQYHTGDR